METSCIGYLLTTLTRSCGEFEIPYISVGVMNGIINTTAKMNPFCNDSGSC